MDSPAEQVIDLYERRANSWVADRQRTSFAERTWIERFMSLIPPGVPLLDVGCGSGEPIARFLIEHGFDVFGVDSSETMISLCRGKFPERTWWVADMRNLSLKRTYGGIIAWDSLFHLSPDNQRQMIPTFREHAASNAALLFTSGPSHGEVIGSLQGEALYHASLSADEYRSLLCDNGFVVRSHVVEDPDCERRTVWLAQLSR
jgi:SAM-dependent methyltransferase